MPKIKPFAHYSDEYDNWIVINNYALQSKVNAIKTVLPANGQGFVLMVTTICFVDNIYKSLEEINRKSFITN